MASFSALRDGLAARLDTIPGVQAYARPPGSINAPAAIIIPSSNFLNFDATMARGSDEFAFTVRLLVPMTVGEIAQDALDAYLEGAGEYSVKTAIEGGGTMGGICSFAVVTGAQGYGSYEYGGIDYLGCEFTVEITA